MRIDDRIVDELFPDGEEETSKPERAQIIEKFKEYYSQFLADKNYPVKDIMQAIIEIVWEMHSENSGQFDARVIPLNVYPTFMNSLKVYLEILVKIENSVMKDWNRIKDFGSLK